ncbi:hypothetical protein AMTR_s00638p00003060, partial [Amborella trichopoda]
MATANRFLGIQVQGRRGFELQGSLRLLFTKSWKRTAGEKMVESCINMLYTEILLINGGGGGFGFAKNNSSKLSFSLNHIRKDCMQCFLSEQSFQKV